jgi:hypothetical protein
MTVTITNELRRVLQLWSQYGIKIDEVGADTFRIRSEGGAALQGIDLNRNYPSWDVAAQTVMNALEKTGVQAA